MTEISRDPRVTSGSQTKRSKGYSPGRRGKELFDSWHKTKSTENPHGSKVIFTTLQSHIKQHGFNKAGVGEHRQTILDAKEFHSTLQTQTA